MKKIMILVVLAAFMIAPGAWAKAPPGPGVGSTIIGPGVGVTAYECFPQVMFESNAALYHFYATHPSSGKFSLDLNGQLQPGKTLADLGTVTASIRQESAVTLTKTANCVDMGGVNIKCAVQYDSTAIPTQVRLRSSTGCGFSPYVPLGYGLGTDMDGDGVSNPSDACPSTPFGNDVGPDGCELPATTISDADGDSVPDSLDECPGTESGASVDSNGCSAEQLAALAPDDDEGEDEGGEGDISFDQPIPDAGGVADVPSTEPGTPMTMSGESGGACSLIAR